MCINALTGSGFVYSLLHDYRIQKTLNVLLGVDIITPETASQHAQKQQEPTHPTPEAATSQANKEASKEEKSGDPDDPINKVCQEFLSMPMRCLDFLILGSSRERTRQQCIQEERL